MDISKNTVFVCQGGPNVRVPLNFVLQSGSKFIFYCDQGR